MSRDINDEKLYPPQYERMARAGEFYTEVYDENSDKTQCEYTLEYLRAYGSITPLEALRAFSCLRLGARISDLRKIGIEIETEMNPSGKRYAIYRLMEGEE